MFGSLPFPLMLSEFVGEDKAGGNTRLTTLNRLLPVVPQIIQATKAVRVARS